MSTGSTVTSTTGGGMAGDDVELGKKLLVHIAENGHSYEFECDGATSIGAIQKYLEGLCGIAVADQLMLCANISLDSQQSLSYYKLPQEHREVFVYNRSRLLADSPRPPPEIIDVPSVIIPPAPSADNLPLPSTNSDPALRALVSYELQFRYHFQVGNAIYDGCQIKYEVCRRLARELHVQERALDSARGNLDLTFRKLHMRHTDFTKCFMEQHRGHADLLMNFERYLERLRALILHQALQSPGRKCLIDLIKESEMRKWAEVCMNSHRQFEAKVDRLKANFLELKKRVENLFGIMSSTNSKELETLIKDHLRGLHEQKSIMQSLSKDVNKAKNLVDECSNSQLSASLRPHDAVSAVGRMYEVHEKDNLPNMRKWDLAMSRLLDKCKGKKNDMNMSVHVCMQKVKSLQLSIKEMMNELHAFHEVVGQQERDFENIRLISGMGHAYRACLAEVVRRRSSFKLYMGLAGQLAEKLAEERDTEIRRRDDFARTWGKYIPSDIFASMGLFDLPSQCDVNVAPFDGGLLQIELEDIDRLAPQSLTGLVGKTQLSMPRNFSSVSGNFVKSEQNSPCSGERTECQELPDYSDSIDISGTCKIEVENTRLRAELASAMAIICSFQVDMCLSTEEDQMDNTLQRMKEKTVEALGLKDEYANQLQSMLLLEKEKCLSYEKRIQELEQKLATHCLQGQNSSEGKATSDFLLAFKASNYNLDGSGAVLQLPCGSNVPMDGISSTSASMNQALDKSVGHDKHLEGGDENMPDISGPLNTRATDSAHNSVDSMMGPSRDDIPVRESDQLHRMINPQLDDSCHAVGVSSDNLNGETNNRLILHSLKESTITELQNALIDKSKRLDETESNLKSVLAEFDTLKRELEQSRTQLDESQINCAHLENCLHESREEALTNKCAADRRAAEYDALRISALKIRSLFERLRSCVSAPGMAGFSDSLCSLALSLASSSKGDEGDEFLQCVKIMADKVGYVSKQNSELLDRLSNMEASSRQLQMELEEKNGLVKSIYAKHQLEKQASREKISFSLLKVHELAAFVRNSAGNYEAINRESKNYFLSHESVALFTEKHSCLPTYIIGQIVHMERRIVRPPPSAQSDLREQLEAVNSDTSDWRPLMSRSSASNPYSLPSGCEYFVVTIAMLPDSRPPTS